MVSLLKRSRPVVRRARAGFTLVELLVVLVIFLILVAIALPIVKGLISDQKATRTAQNIEAFLNAARSRAIAEGRTVGVRFERLGSLDGDDYARSACLRLRQLVGVPAYSGDAADAVADLSGSPVNTANFSTSDSPLLYLSSEIWNDGNDNNNYLAPIQLGDMLELPGGRSVPITTIGVVSGSTVPVTFNLAENTAIDAYFVNKFPTASSAVGGKVKYRIHRSPMPSSSTVMSLPQGMAIDLNYSGVGISSSEFAPAASGTVRAVDVLFNANGTVTQVIHDDVHGREFPNGLIYFCVGEIDAVASLASGTVDDPFSQDTTLTTNIMNTESLWVVINPASGRVTTVPMASVRTIPPAGTIDITAAEYQAAVKEARYFATLSDTVAE